jgi:hypothetical protein
MASPHQLAPQCHVHLKVNTLADSSATAMLSPGDSDSEVTDIVSDNFNKLQAMADANHKVDYLPLLLYLF